ncbi:MAG: hypothetical protein COB37_03830 [Kordiimonadales bacterium]|nr:MAG: hypothetical protein COB37_03830 [Kordiimonadales bacterium]
MRARLFQATLKTSVSFLVLLGFVAAKAAEDTDTKPTLEEIIVTAQKREQSQQDVPITLTAFSADFLKTIAAENLRDLNAYTPGLEVTGVSQPRFKIRGIETDDFGVGTDPAVGVYVDGVYSSRSGAAIVFFSDIARIEVLKGPQGTLFGRNAAAGAISIHTNKPQFEDFSGQLKLRYGRFDKRQFDVVLNVPLADNLAVRANFLFNEQDGFAEDFFTGDKYGREDNKTGRFQVRWQPSDRTNINLSYEFDRTDQDEDRPIVSLANGTQRAPIGAETVRDLPGHGAFLAGIAPLFGLPIDRDTPLEQLFAIPLGTIYAGFGQFGYVPSNPDADFDFFAGPDSPGGASPFGPASSDIGGGQERRDLDAVTLNITHDFNWGTLTSLSAFKQFTSNNLQDDDGTADINFFLTTNNVEENESYYQELRLNGEHGRFIWTLGSSFFYEEAEQISVVNATTNSIDRTLYNLGVTPGVLALAFDPTDGINGCESIFLDSLGGFISFNNLPLNCINPAFSGSSLDGQSLEGLANAIGTTLSGRLFSEQFEGNGTSKAFAAFADTSFAATNRLNIHVGLRYTYDRKSWIWFNDLRTIEGSDGLNVPGVGNLADLQQQLLTGIFQQLLSPTSSGDLIFDTGVCDDSAGPDPVCEGRAFTRTGSWNNLSPRVAFDYRVADDVIIYGSFTRGYKAGGFNTLEINSFFENETVSNFELGLKSQWLDNSVRANIALWHYIYNDRQDVRLISSNTSSIPQFLTVTDDLSGKGIDFEFLWAAAPGLQLFSNGIYQDIVCTDGCGRANDGDPTGEPSVRVSFGADYAYTLGSENGVLNFHVDHSYTSKVRLNGECIARQACGTVTFSGVSYETGEARNITSARVGWSSEDAGLSVSIFATNLFGNRYAGRISGFGLDSFGAAVTRPTDPSVWGIDVTKRF